MPACCRAEIIARLRGAGCVFAEDEADLLISAAATPAELTAMADRRVGGLPLEQVVGWAEFCGLRIAVEPGVFVPRRRTEFLVRQAASLARTPGTVVVDLCCGAGAIGAALAAALGEVELHAADADPVAVACARRNLAGLGQVHQGDLFAPLPGSLRRRIDVLAANVPYVPTGEIALLPAESRLHEPPLAVDGGADGLDVARRVAAAALDWLAPGGVLLIETSERQAPVAAAFFAAAGLSPRVTRSGQMAATVVCGARPLRAAGGHAQDLDRAEAGGDEGQPGHPGRQRAAGEQEILAGGGGPAGDYANGHGHGEVNSRNRVIKNLRAAGPSSITSARAHARPRGAAPGPRTRSSRPARYP